MFVTASAGEFGLPLVFPVGLPAPPCVQGMVLARECYPSQLHHEVDPAKIASLGFCLCGHGQVRCQASPDSQRVVFPSAD